MPYIKYDRRHITACIEDRKSLEIRDAGELNYFITGVILKYIKDKGIRYNV